MSIRDSIFNTRDTLFERKGAEKIFHANNNKKRLKCLYQYQTKQAWRLNIGLTDKNYIRGLIHQEDTHMNMTMTQKYMKQKLLKLKGEIASSEITVRHFNNPVSIMNKLDKD